MALISQRTKLVLKDLGNPDAIKSQKDDVKRLVLGTLVGRASGFIERTNPKDGEVMEGLTGEFRSIPADAEADQLESGVLFIPDAFHNLIAARLKKAKEADANAVINFAFEVASVRATNPQGRSWDFKPMIDPGEENPMDKLVSSLGALQIKDGRRVLALAAPEKPAATTAKK